MALTPKSVGDNATLMATLKHTLPSFTRDIGQKYSLKHTLPAVIFKD
jgi:hypothetical protein